MARQLAAPDRKPDRQSCHQPASARAKQRSGRHGRELVGRNNGAATLGSAGTRSKSADALGAQQGAPCAAQARAVSRQCPRHETLKPHAACRLALRLRRSSSAISASLRRSARYSTQAHPSSLRRHRENGLAFDTSGPVARVVHLMRGGAVASAHALLSLLVLPYSATPRGPSSTVSTGCCERSRRTSEWHKARIVAQVATLISASFTS